MGRRQVEMMQRRDGDGEAEMEVVERRQRERCGRMPPAAVPRSTSAALPSCTIVFQVGHCLAFLTAKRGVPGMIAGYSGGNLLRAEFDVRRVTASRAWAGPQ